MNQDLVKNHYFNGGKEIYLSRQKDNSLELKNRVVEWIKEWHESVSNGSAPIIIGISGGLDSSVVAALCVEAVGVDKVKGVLLPYGNQHDISDSLYLCNHLGLDYKEINIKESVDTTIEKVEKSLSVKLRNDVIGNIQSRERMLYLYGYSQQLGGFVSNNCNKAERFIGYSTIFGDMAGDFSPLSDLSKREVVNIAYALGLPTHLVEKTPIDGLQTNINGDGGYNSDEKAMGFSYDELDDYMYLYQLGVEEPLQSEEANKNILKKHQFSSFKRFDRISYFIKK